MSAFSTVDEIIPVTQPGRGQVSSSRLDEHLRATANRLKKLGVRPGACVASALPEGPDAVTAAMASKLAQANFASLPPRSTHLEYEAFLVKINPTLLIVPSGAHPVREVARNLNIPIADVLRHFEAGVFSLEAEIAPVWQNRARGVPVVLIAPGYAYLGLANRLGAIHPVIGITSPRLEDLALPHTIEHIAAECVRMLRGYRLEGPYALTGWRSDGLVALEMARLLEEEGEKVTFVALLDASALFDAPSPSWKTKLFGKKCAKREDLMEEALGQYCPLPWFGKILHLRSSEEPDGKEGTSRLEWRQIAPHGVESYNAPAEMLAERNVHVVATILAAQLAQASNFKK